MFEIATAVMDLMGLHIKMIGVKQQKKDQYEIINDLDEFDQEDELILDQSINQSPEH